MDLRIEGDDLAQLVRDLANAGIGAIDISIQPPSSDGTAAIKITYLSADGSGIGTNTIHPRLLPAVNTSPIKMRRLSKLGSTAAVDRALGLPPCPVHGGGCAGYGSWDCIARIWVAQTNKCESGDSNTQA
jgi:hypothetical protein